MKCEKIVSMALALVDREGLKALSMRRLGTELGVDPMAVYYHIPNKQALLDAIVEAVMASIDLSVDDPQIRRWSACCAPRGHTRRHACSCKRASHRALARSCNAAAMRPVEFLSASCVTRACRLTGVCGECNRGCGARSRQEWGAVPKVRERRSGPD